MVATPRPARVTPRQIEEQFDDNLEAIDILKKSGPVGIFFLVAYIVIDWRTNRGAKSGAIVQQGNADEWRGRVFAGRSVAGLV